MPLPQFVGKMNPAHKERNVSMTMSVVKLGNTQARILGILRTKHVSVTVRDLAAETGLSRAAVKDTLRRLRKRGLAASSGRLDAQGTFGWQSIEVVRVAPSFRLF